jgi:hypothetical protein
MIPLCYGRHELICSQYGSFAQRGLHDFFANEPTALTQETGQPGAVRTNEAPRCPYCTRNGEFRMMKVFEDGKQICEECGHTVFANDRMFRCQCHKCLNADRFSVRVKVPRI